LARKWRPRSFAEVVGQSHVVQALSNALNSGRVHHAFLFTGTRGVGKTTLARIFAKSLNCENGTSAEPCQVCNTCVAIDEGRYIDLIEIDAASRTKVDDTRELLETVQYAPSFGKYKVYLIDEVHMLSTHSFNALLKTLEEPPPHVKFLLATTDPQKLPATILSRCLQFNLKNLSPERIVEHLQFVLGEEKVPAEEAGLWSLARAADGSMRDALSLTDQAIAHGGGKLTEAEVGAMLGTIDLTAIADIARGLANGDGTEVLAVVQRMSEHAPDYTTALGDLLSIWHRVAIAQTVPDALDNRHGDYQLVLELSKALSREDVQLFYQIALLGRRDITLAPEHRAGFEMVLLRMLAFQPVAESRVDPPAPSVSHTSASHASVSHESPASTEEAAVLVKKSEAAPTTGSRIPEEPLELPEHGPLESTSEFVSEPEPELKPEPELGSISTEAERQISPVSPPPESMPSTIPPVFDDQAVPPQVMDGEPVSAETLLSLSHEAHSFEADAAYGVEGFSAQPAITEPPTAELPVREQSSADVVESKASMPSQPIPSQPRLIEKLPLSSAEPKRWIEIYQGLAVGGILQNTAANLVLVDVRGHAFRFQLDINHSAMYEQTHQHRLVDVLSNYFGEPVTVDIEVGPVTSETPHAHRERTRAERQASAVESLKHDPNVRRIQDVLGGVLLENTVKPID
ncbi:MAG: DNA polymerase III subunit gamma/tau, partial [Porticoccus sp.]|nr:DNA polymerase III subunit gamma/tau [Porticoccus sp.]